VCVLVINRHRIRQSPAEHLLSAANPVSETSPNHTLAVKPCHVHSPIRSNDNSLRPLDLLFGERILYPFALPGFHFDFHAQLHRCRLQRLRSHIDICIVGNSLFRLRNHRQKPIVLLRSKGMFHRIPRISSLHICPVRRIVPGLWHGNFVGFHFTRLFFFLQNGQKSLRAFRADQSTGYRFVHQHGDQSGQNRQMFASLARGSNQKHQLHRRPIRRAPVYTFPERHSAQARSADRTALGVRYSRGAAHCGRAFFFSGQYLFIVRSGIFQVPAPIVELHQHIQNALFVLCVIPDQNPLRHQKISDLHRSSFSPRCGRLSPSIVPPHRKKIH